MRFRIHPLFFVLALALIAFGQALAFIWAFAAVCLHEIGHALAARARGYTVNSLVLLPFGAVMCADDELDGTSSVIVGLAGPLANVFLALATLGLWWLTPAAYPYTEPFLYANVSIAAFNLLPVYPLDGSRVVLGLARNRLKAVKALQIAGVCVSAVMFALFVASAVLLHPLFTVGISAVFLFYGAAFAAKEECYRSVLNAEGKNYGLGVTEKCVYVARDMPIARMFHHVDSRSRTLFKVVDRKSGGGEKGAPEVLFTVTEEQLKAAAACGRLSRTAEEALK